MKEEKIYGPTFSIIVILIIAIVIGWYAFEFLREEIEKNTELIEKEREEKELYEYEINKDIFEEDGNTKILIEKEGELSDEEIEELIDNLLEERTSEEN